MIDRRNLFGGFEVNCDVCDENLAIHCDDIKSVTVKNAIETARMYDWSIGKQNLCPKCRRNEKLNEITWFHASTDAQNHMVSCKYRCTKGEYS